MSSLSTSLTLLERLRVPGDQDAWERFVEIYTPLLYCWAGRAGLKGPDAFDLLQEVMLQLVQKLPEFDYQQRGSFRGWLRTVLLNKHRDFQRRRKLPVGDIDPVDVADPGGATEFWEREYHLQLAARALDLMRSQFAESSWKACWETIVLDRPAAEVAQELGMTLNALYVARSRVLQRVREYLAGFWE